MNKYLTVSGVSLEKGNPKYMSKAYKRFCNEFSTTLDDVYKTYSSEKESAFNHCKEIFNKLGGEHFTIVSHNGWSFCVGFRLFIGNERYFCYITPYHKRICSVREFIKYDI